MAGRPTSLAPVLLVLAGCGVSPPGRLETALATAVKHHLTVRDAGGPNPIAATPALVERGRADFTHYCLVCHGLDGHATGVPFAAALDPPVPDLGSAAVQGYSDGQLRWIVEHGLAPSGMPAAQGILNDEEMWRIVLYLRHLPPAGSLGEPAVYGEPAPTGATGSRR
jgi:mono/diheme cytochrome c family protein